MSLERTYTSQEVAAALGCTAGTVRRYVRQGIVTPARLGTHMRFTTADYEALLLACRPIKVAPKRKRKRRGIT